MLSEVEQQCFVVSQMRGMLLLILIVILVTTWQEVSGEGPAQKDGRRRFSISIRAVIIDTSIWLFCYWNWPTIRFVMAKLTLEHRNNV